jgi:hypothetical protein
VAVKAIQQKYDCVYRLGHSLTVRDHCFVAQGVMA